MTRMKGSSALCVCLVIAIGTLCMACLARVSGSSQHAESAAQPELHPEAVVPGDKTNKLHLQLHNSTSDSWTIETENDWARGRIQLYSEENGWQDMLAYDWCGTGIAWMQLLPGGTIDLTVAVDTDIRRLRVGVRMLKGPMRLSDEFGSLWPPESDVFMAYSEPIKL